MAGRLLNKSLCSPIAILLSHDPDDLTSPGHTCHCIVTWCGTVCLSPRECAGNLARVKSSRYYSARREESGGAHLARNRPRGKDPERIRSRERVLPLDEDARSTSAGLRRSVRGAEPVRPVSRPHQWCARSRGGGGDARLEDSSRGAPR